MRNDFRKSSYSSNTGQCLEAAADGAVLVRDSKDMGTGPVLRLTPDDWTRFVAGLK